MKNLQEEIRRKVFHFLALLPICFFVYFIPNKYFFVIIPFVLVVFVFDFFNLYFFLEKKNIKCFNFFFSLLRSHERNKYTLNGSTWILISIVFCFLLNFEKNIQFAGFFILAVSDSLAAIFGKKYGKIKILNKTLEGSIAFFISCFFCVFLILGYDNNYISLNFLLKSFFLSASVTFIELFAEKLRLNDNFLLPTAFCFLNKLWNGLIGCNFFSK